MNRFITVILSFVSATFLLLTPVSGGDNPVVCRVLAFSNDNPLPLETIGVLASLQNVTYEEQKLKDSDMGYLYLRVRYPDSRIGESASTPSGDSTNTFIITLRPKGDRVSKNLLGYLENGTHAFSEPGIKVSVSGRIADINSDFAISINVQPLSKRDQQAYEFLKPNSLPNGFYWASGNMPKLPDTPENVAAMQKFISNYHDSRYANLARLGLGILYMRMSRHIIYDATTKSWLPREDSANNKNLAISTFKGLIAEYSDAKGEKGDQRKDDNTGVVVQEHARVDKHVMFWASQYLGEILTELLPVGTTLTNEVVAERLERNQEALTIYDYALSQEPNDYWKLTFQPLRDKTAKSIEVWEKGK